MQVISLQTGLSITNVVPEVPASDSVCVQCHLTAFATWSHLGNTAGHMQARCRRWAAWYTTRLLVMIAPKSTLFSVLIMVQTAALGRFSHVTDMGRRLAHAGRVTQTRLSRCYRAVLPQCQTVHATLSCSWSTPGRSSTPCPAGPTSLSCMGPK